MHVPSQSGTPVRRGLLMVTIERTAVHTDSKVTEIAVGITVVLVAEDAGSADFGLASSDSAVLLILHCV